MKLEQSRQDKIDEINRRAVKDELLSQARRVYWSYTLRVKGETDPDWEQKLMIGEFDERHGVQIALEALRSVENRRAK